METIFLELFPQWAQDAHWSLTNTQRACAVVASALKNATQVNIPKAVGYRPLAMLEESFKIIEGLPARRRSAARLGSKLGSVYSASNLAGEARQQATSAVLCLDAMLCEDSIRHGRPFSRLASDYEKFYNTMEKMTIDAAEECRGVPDDARTSFHESFGGIKVHIETRWGLTPPVDVSTGIPQGSVSWP